MRQNGCKDRKREAKELTKLRKDVKAAFPYLKENSGAFLVQRE